MKPIRMSWVLAPVVAEEEEEVVEEAPLMLELHASSSPPPPTTAALAPATRSKPRRLTPSAGLVLSGCAVWSLMCNRSPLRSRRGRGTAYELTPYDPCGLDSGCCGVMRLTSPKSQ